MTKAPIVDLNNVDQAALVAIDKACRDHGFFLLKGHGLEDIASAMWAESESFFALDHATKSKVRRSEEYPLGYYDRELTKRRRDQKEVFDFFVEPETGGRVKAKWPEGLDTFRKTMRAYHQANAEVARKVLGLVCLALGLEEGALEHTLEDGHSSITRLNHYPHGDPVPAGETHELTELGDMSLGHHTDPGSITLLMQDDVGGLQAWSRSDNWFDVAPVEGTIVINMGDMMQVWSNDQYKAAMHRVKRQPVERSRYSSPFFFQPSTKTVIEPLQGQGTPKFKTFAWADYIGGRVADNYADIGEDDIQIERFRIS